MNTKPALGVIFLMLSLASYAQLELETLPATTKWQRIRTDHFDVIFPRGFESEGNRTANILETIYRPASKSLGVSPRRFSVVLQNQNAIANGFVALFPRRSEFFTTSTQDYKFLGNTDWLEFLALHEYRHMVQMELAFQSKTNRVMRVLFGEPGVGFVSAIASPAWSWEGDAIGVETAFSNTGRGRTPNFEKEFKANILAKGGFNYSKQHLRSFKDFVPDHYRTGYFMTTYLKRRYGVDIGGRIIEQAFDSPFVPFAFSNAMKKETGAYLLQNYGEMMAEITRLYEQQTADITPDDNTPVNQRTDKTYTNYDYPSMLSNGDIVALKSGFSDIEHFVSIDASGNETPRFTTGIINDAGYLSINNDIAVWVEFEFDPRWSKKTYSVIKTYDFKNNQFKRISNKSKYVSAAISPDGNTIATIENTTDNQYYLMLIDYHTGRVIRQFDNPANDYYSAPVFSPDGKSLVLSKTTAKAKALVRIAIDSGAEEVLFESEKENFGHPMVGSTYLYYNSPVNGIDNIYAFHLKNKAVYQVTHAKYGAFNPSLSRDGTELIYNEFSPDGMDVVRMAIDPDKWTAKADVINRNINYSEPIVEDEGHPDLLKSIASRQYEIKPYRKLRHAIRPYAWGLSAIPTNTSVLFGINSQDILSTTSISAGLQFDNDENNWLRFASISYQGLYPIIDFTVIDGTRSLRSPAANPRIPSFDWRETSLIAGLRVPLMLTNSRYLRRLSLGVKSIFTSVSDFNLSPRRAFIDQPGNGQLNAIEYRASFTSVLRRSKRDINSRFGQTLLISYKHTPLGGDYGSELLAVESNVFLPGLARHHSVQLRAGYQHEKSDNYFFDSPIRHARGFRYFPFRDFTNLSLNYAMPLWYPDIHFGPLLNIQRVYVNGFYDYGRGRPPGRRARYQPRKSYGVELSFDFNIMRFQPLLNMGLRYSYLPDFNYSTTEIIVGGVTF